MKPAKAKKPMKIVFYVSDKPREIMLAKALEKGVDSWGDTFELRRTADYGEDADGNDHLWPGPSPDTDVACCFGVKGHSQKIMRDHLLVEKSVLFFDKGYTREKGVGGHTLYSRICVNAGDPLGYMMREDRPRDRWAMLGLRLAERRVGGVGHLLLCTASQKFNDFYGLGDSTQYAAKIVGQLSKISNRQIVYRPKQSWAGAVPISGASFSRPPQSLMDAMRGCSCLVTFGTTAAFEAVIAGIPVLVLGNSIARPVAEKDIDNVETPYWPTLERRQQWANNVAYCQWTVKELESGLAWRYLREEIVYQRVKGVPDGPYGEPGTNDT